MCGIAGFVSTISLPVKIDLEALTKQLERGTDATGVMYLLNDNLFVIKSTQHPNTFYQEFKYNHSSNIVVAHNRKASNNDKSVNASHPFLSTDNVFALVHNGRLSEHKTIRFILELLEKPFESENDTEVITRLMELIYPNEEKIEQFVKLARPGVIVMLDIHKILWMIRSHNPLCACWNEPRTIFLFASTENALKHMKKQIEKLVGKQKWEKTHELKTETLATVIIADGKVVFDEKKFHKKSFWSSWMGPGMYGYGYTYRDCPYKANPALCPWKKYYKCSYVWAFCPYKN